MLYYQFEFFFLFFSKYEKIYRNLLFKINTKICMIYFSAEPILKDLIFKLCFLDITIFHPNSLLIMLYWIYIINIPIIRTGLKTKYCLFLTGTPVMARPIEAFSLLSYLDKERFNNFFHFTQRYGGWKGDLPRNLPDLHDREWAHHNGF